MFREIARQCMSTMWNAGQHVLSASGSALQHMTGYGATGNDNAAPATLAATIDDQRQAASETCRSTGPRSILKSPGKSSVHAGKQRVLTFAETRQVKEVNQHPEILWHFNKALIRANDAVRYQPSKLALLASHERLQGNMDTISEQAANAAHSKSLKRSIRRYMKQLSKLASNGDSAAYQTKLDEFRQTCQPRLVRSTRAWSPSQSAEISEAVPTDDWEYELIRAIDAAYETALTTKPDLDEHLAQLLADVEEFVSRMKPSDANMDELNDPVQDLFLAAQDRDVTAYAEGLQSLRSAVAGGPKPIEASCDRLSRTVKEAARSAPATAGGIDSHWTRVRKTVMRGIKEIGFDDVAQGHIEHSIERVLLAVSNEDGEAYRKGLKSLSRRVKTLPDAIEKLAATAA